jgi:hypothetical protein
MVTYISNVTDIYVSIVLTDNTSQGSSRLSVDISCHDAHSGTVACIGVQCFVKQSFWFMTCMFNAKFPLGGNRSSAYIARTFDLPAFNLPVIIGSRTGERAKLGVGGFSTAIQAHNNTIS